MEQEENCTSTSTMVGYLGYCKAVISVTNPTARQTCYVTYAEDEELAFQSKYQMAAKTSGELNWQCNCGMNLQAKE